MSCNLLCLCSWSSMRKQFSSKIKKKLINKIRILRIDKLQISQKIQPVAKIADVRTRFDRKRPLFGYSNKLRMKFRNTKQAIVQPTIQIG